MPKMARKIEDRFWEKVNRDGPIQYHMDTPCWEWIHTLWPSGYGKFKCEHKNKRANRVAWVITYGKIPDGMLVLHDCDNPKCVNPEHLFLGTHLDNAKDREQKGRGRNWRAQGDKHPNAKLTLEKVAQIRQRFANGETARDLAKEFGIHHQTIYPIISRKRWNY
jgi:hypothetical protein